MTKRFIKEDIHELMMKTSTDYAVNEKFGMHDIVDGLENLVGSRNAERENGQQYLTDGLSNRKTELEEKKDYIRSQGFLPSDQPHKVSKQYNECKVMEMNFKEWLREKNLKEDRNELIGKGYDPSLINRLSSEQLGELRGIEAQKSFLKRNGYDISGMSVKEIQKKARAVADED